MLVRVDLGLGSDMYRSKRVLVTAFVGSILALIVAFAAMAMGPGTMGGAFGGYGGGGAGSAGNAVPTGAQLTQVRNHVNVWLTSNGFKGFTVAEVMAFTNNDYVAVRDKSGKPAFELLTNLEDELAHGGAAEHDVEHAIWRDGRLPVRASAR